MSLQAEVRVYNCRRVTGMFKVTKPQNGGKVFCEQCQERNWSRILLGKCYLSKIVFLVNNSINYIVDLNDCACSWWWIDERKRWWGIYQLKCDNRSVH